MKDLISIIVKKNFLNKFKEILKNLKKTKIFVKKMCNINYL